MGTRLRAFCRLYLSFSLSPSCSAKAASEEFSKPAYIIAGLYKEEFERANANLNNIADWLKYEGLARSKEACAQQGTVEELTYDTYRYRSSVDLRG